MRKSRKSRNRKKTYRGKGFYLFSGTLCAVIVLVLAICIGISLMTLGRSKQYAGEALDAAIMAYDLYLQEISNEAPWTDELAALNVDGLLEGISSARDPESMELLRQRIATYEETYKNTGVSLYVYFAEADFLLGSVTGTLDARTYTSSLAWLDFSALWAEQSYISFMLENADGRMCTGMFEALYPSLALFSVHFMPELPNLSVLAPIREVTEMYFIDCFGHTYSFGEQQSLIEAFDFSMLQVGESSGFVDIEYEGQPYHCYYHDVSPGYIKFALIAPDIVGVAYAEFTRAIWIAGALLILLGCLLGLYLTRRVYAPLQAIIARLSPAGESVRDEFKLISYALSAMENRLTAQAGLLSSFHMMRLLRGQAVSPNEAKNFFFHEPGACCAVVIFRLEEGGGLQGLHDALLSYMEDNRRECCCAEDSGFLFAVCDASGGGLLQLLDRFRILLAQRDGLLISAFISDAYSGPDMLHTAYSEAMALLAYETMQGAFNLVADYDALRMQAACGQEAEDEDVFTRMLSYVQLHYRDPNISTSVLVDRFCLSQSSVSRLFKQRNDRGFLECLHRLRIEKARELLLDSSLTVAEVSAMAGYTNVLTMTRAFKRYTGGTPGSFRK